MDATGPWVTAIGGALDPVVAFFCLRCTGAGLTTSGDNAQIAVPLAIGAGSSIRCWGSTANARLAGWDVAFVHLVCAVDSNCAFCSTVFADGVGAGVCCSIALVFSACIVVVTVIYNFDAGARLASCSKGARSG